MTSDKNNIAMLDNDYARKQTAKYQEQHRQMIFRRRRLTLVIGLFAGIFVFVGLQLFTDYQRLQSLKEIKQEAVADHQLVADNVTQLEKDVQLLKDEDYVAKLARSKYYYSKPNEFVYSLPEAANDDKAAEKKVDEAIDNNQSSTTDK